MASSPTTNLTPCDPSTATNAPPLPSVLAPLQIQIQCCWLPVLRMETGTLSRAPRIALGSPLRSSCHHLQIGFLRISCRW